MADQIEEVKQKSDIVAVIAEYINLKKAGRNYKALCPFHSEKTASFMVSPELQIYKCFGCFPAGQFVKTPFGYHEIQNVVGGEYVISGSGSLRRVLMTHKRDYVGKLMTIKISQLTEPVSLTADHLVYTIGGAKTYSQNYKNLSRRLNYYKKHPKCKRQELIWKYFPITKVCAGNLKKGVSLLFPIDSTVKDVKTIDLSDYITKKWPPHGTKPIIPELEIKIDNNFLKLIGYYIAEGSSHRAYIRFSISDSEESFAKDITKIVKEVFNLDAKICRKHNGQKTGTEISVCNSILANVFENLCGLGAQNKHIPFIFQQLPTSKQLILLESIYRGDGFQTKLKGKVKNPRRSIITVSRTLSEQLVDILLRLGFYPSRYVQREKRDKSGVNHKKSFTIGWCINSRASKFHHRYEAENGDLYWILPILKVDTKHVSEKVFNLTVDQDHSYVANNFAVANCGETGDVYSFLEKYEGMEFGEALRFLANRAGVRLKPLASGEYKEKERLLEINRLAARFYHYLLLNHKVGKEALVYLTRERGLRLATIKKFQLGFSPLKVDALAKFFIKRKKGTKEELIRSGLVYQGQGGIFDRFSGRVIFPLNDHRGNVVGFAGRILPGNNKGEKAKYINTPETPLYHKSRILYGLDLSKKEIKKEKQAVVVEGEIDLISCWQAGIRNVVAIKGSALTEDQISLITRFSEKLTLALDSDFAGDAAARRGIATAFGSGIELKVASLEDYKDPDEMARKNPKALIRSLKNSVGIWDFFISSIFAKYDAKSGEGKSKISKELIPILSSISDRIVQAHYIEKVAKLLNVPVSAVSEEVIKSEPSLQPKKEKEISFKPEAKKERRQLLEERLLVLIFHLNPKMLLDKRYFSFIKSRLYLRLIDEVEKYFKKNKEFDTAGFSENLPKELFEGYSKIILSDIEDISEEADRMVKELEVVEREIKILDIKEKITSLSLKMLEQEKNKDREGLEKTKKEFSSFTSRLNQLEETTDKAIIL